MKVIYFLDYFSVGIYECTTDSIVDYFSNMINLILLNIDLNFSTVYVNSKILKLYHNTTISIIYTDFTYYSINKDINDDFKSTLEYIFDENHIKRKYYDREDEMISK